VRRLWRSFAPAGFAGRVHASRRDRLLFRSVRVQAKSPNPTLILQFLVSVSCAALPTIKIAFADHCITELFNSVTRRSCCTDPLYATRYQLCVYSTWI
jgi:hypothetical protein